MRRGRWTAAMAAGVVLALAAPALAAPAELDDTFGTDGVAIVTLHEPGGFTFQVSDVAVAGDGSTVLLGGILRVDGFGDVVPGVDFDLAVARLDPTGQLDTTFGTDGVARLDDGGFELPAKLVLDGAGRIVFGANRIDQDGTTTTIIGRLTAAGVLDQTFAEGGLATLSAAAVQYSNGLTIDDADRPVVALVVGDDPDGAETADAIVTRLTATGQVDATFGTGGTATVLAGRSGAFGITGDGDGGYLVTGVTDELPFVSRIDATGAVDTAFGNGGVARLPVTGGIGMVVQRADDGALLVGGTVGTRTGLVARLDATGQPATSFGRGGVRTVRADLGGPMPVTSIAAGSAGTVTFVAPQQSASARATIGRLLASGAEDSAFGGDGYVHPLDGSGRTVSAGMAVAAGPHDTLVTAGIAGTDSEVDAFAARLRRARPPGAAVTAGPVRRVAGADRVGTAVHLSRTTFAAAGTQPGRTANEVVLAASDRFPDALVAAPYAAAAEAPLLLNPPTRLDPLVLGEVQRVLPDGGRVTLMGGTGALGPAVEDELAAAGFSVGRIAGADRYETSVRVAELLAPAAALLARGDAFPDALAAGPAAAEINGVVLLTAGDRLPGVVRDHLAGQPELTRYAVGGQAATAAPGAEAVAGPDRYATAALVAERFFHTPSRTVVASGQRFPDALAGGTHASLTGSPLLLTTRRSLPEPTRQALLAIRPFHRSVTVAGGTAIIDDAVLEAVGGATS